MSMEYLNKARELDAKVLDIWRKAASEKCERYNTAKKVFEAVANPAYANPQTLRESIKEAITEGAAIIELPRAVIRKDQLIIEAFKSIGNICEQIVEYPFLQVANDPVFEVPAGVTIYKTNGSAGKYWALSGYRLVECIDEKGAAITFNRDTEGYKARLERLKREEEARQHQAEIERLKRETEAEEARQESQLNMLKALPSDKFKKLMSLLNG